jgi:hypothetical protein
MSMIKAYINSYASFVVPGVLCFAAEVAGQLLYKELWGEAMGHPSIGASPFFF